MASSFASVAQTYPWARRIGNVTVGEGPGFFNMDNDHVSNIRLGSDSSIYIAAETRGVEITVGNDTISGFLQTTNAFIAKLNPAGQTLWTFAPAGFYRAKYMDIDSLDNVYALVEVRGTFNMDTLSFTNTPPGTLLLLKISSQGSLLWYRTVSPANPFTSTQGLELSSNGDIIWSFTFYQSCSLYDTTFVQYAPSESGLDQIIAKYDANGNSLWYKHLKASDQTILNESYGELAIDASDNIYAFIRFDSLIIDNDSFASMFGNSDVIVKLNSSGGLEWVNRIELHCVPSFKQTIQRSIETTEHGVYVSGTWNMCHDYEFWYNNQFIDSIDDGGYTSYFAQLGFDGSLRFAHFSRNYSFGQSHNMIRDIKSNGDKVYIAGYAKDSIELDDFSHVFEGTSFNSFSGFVLAFDTLTKTYESVLDVVGYSGNQSVSCLAINDHKDMVVGGHFTDEFVVDTLTQPANQMRDAFLFKRLSCDYLDVSLSSPEGNQICDGETTTLLENGMHGEVDYTWLFSGSEIPNNNDSTYDVLIPGSYSVRISDSVCSKTSDPIVVSNYNNPAVAFSPSQDTFCQNDSVFQLDGGTPTGGVYAGPGVSSGVLNPQMLSPGNHTLYYIYNHSSGCIDSVLKTITIQPTPNVTFYQAFNSICADDSAMLNSGLPAGGTYSGTSVFGNVFAPSILDTGMQTLYYTRTNAGCSATDSIQVQVNFSPQVTFQNPVDTTCEVSSPIALSGQSPSGGTFSGTGVSGNFFIPQIVAPGTYPITYSFTQNGCTGSAVDHIHVDSFPLVVLPPLDSICLSATAYPLDHGFPSGGVYSGTGITNNVFDASVAGIGTHTISYIYENACAADTATSTITVIASPALSASVTDVSCNGVTDGAISLNISGGNGPYDVMWNTGDSSWVVSGLSAGTYTASASGDGGCVVSNSFVVSEPAALVSSLDSLDDVVCNGFNDGKAFTSSSGGTLPYTFSWSSGQTTEDVTNLPAGTHQLLVTDINGCQDSLSVTINQVNPIVIASVVSDVTCAGAMDGSITTSASGGGGVFTYAWSNAASVASLTNLDSGSYALTVTDQNSCEASDTFTIASPDSLITTLHTTDISCFGLGDGSIATTTSGGTLPYAFAWSNSAVTDSIGGLSAANYTLTVTDSNGCQTTQSASIGEPDSLDITINLAQGLLCFNDSNGALSAAVSGGTSAYTFNWSTSDTTASVSGLAAGSYTLSVEDANGCTNASEFDLLEPTQLSAAIDSVSEPTCFGYNDGYLSVAASGGTGTLSYLWNTNATSSSISGLDSGAYSITVTDDNGCTSTAGQTLSQPDAISLSLSASPVSCFGGNDGAATVVASNGQGALSYLWTNGDTTSTADSLVAALHSVTVTDAQGCFVSDTISITQPTELTAAYTANNLLCFNDSSGAISASPTGGISPYSYSWSNGELQNNIDTLDAGSYGVTITDANGCEIDSSFTLTQPAQLQLTVDSISDLLCYQDGSGYIATSASGGTPAYDFLWDDNTTSALRSGLSAGSYTLTLTDANGCEADTSLTINEPAELLLTVDSVNHLSCFGDTNGSIAITAGGGTGSLSLLWSNTATSPQITQLVAATYTVTATDDNGCLADSTITVNQPDSIDLQATITPAHCDNTNDGVIATIAAGGTGTLDYLWSNGQSSPTIDTLFNGTYGLTITDDNACSDSFQLVVPFEFTAPVPQLGNDTGFCVGDWMVLDPQVDSVNYNWSTGDTTQFITVFDSGTYTITVTGDGGCLNTASVELDQYQLPEFDLGNDTMLCKADLEEGFTISGPVGMADYLWSSGGTSADEDVFDYGTYTLTVENEEGCLFTDSISIVSDTCVGIADISTAYDLNLYPNPNFGSFTIDVGSPPETDLSYKIYNAEGRLVKKAMLTERQHLIDLSQNGAGVYYLHLLSKTRQPVVRKVVVY